jgi:hypothetical protein
MVTLFYVPTLMILTAPMTCHYGETEIDKFSTTLFSEFLVLELELNHHNEISRYGCCYLRT